MRQVLQNSASFDFALSYQLAKRGGCEQMHSLDSTCVEGLVHHVPSYVRQTVRSQRLTPKGCKCA